MGMSSGALPPIKMVTNMKKATDCGTISGGTTWTSVITARDCDKYLKVDDNK